MFPLITILPVAQIVELLFPVKAGKIVIVIAIMLSEPQLLGIVSATVLVPTVVYVSSPLGTV